jgi:AcrR family transcriptional regulator
MSGSEQAAVTRPGAARRAPGSTTAGRRSRDRILQASLDLITEAGVDRVRLAEIARRAGMSTGQVMYYFTSMGHILLETLAWREKEESSQRRAALAATPAGWPRLERFAELYLPSSLTDPVWILWMEAWARAPHNPEVSGFLDRLMISWRKDLADVVQDGVRAGAFRAPGPDSDFPIRFCAVLDGLSVLLLRQMPDLSIARLVQFAMDTVRAELTPDPGRRAVRPSGG